MARRTVTLLTDFGWNDYYVGAMKGVVLGVNPDANIVDISHGVLAYDILDAAFTLAQAYPCFPHGSIHIVVVDPGVGSQRRPIVVRGDHHYFLAPDNGVLSFVYPRQELCTVYEIKADHYFRRPVSKTFHGRDIFAAVAGWLSRGVEIDKFGDPLDNYVRLSIPRPQKISDKQVKGIVLKIDRFGSLITNITPQDCPPLFAEPTPAFKLSINGKTVNRLVSHFAEGEKGQVFALLGSSGHLEISANKAAASQVLGARRGIEVLLELA